MHSWLREAVAQKQDLTLNTSNCNQKVHNSRALQVLTGQVGCPCRVPVVYTHVVLILDTVLHLTNKVIGTTGNRVTVRILD